MKPTLKVEAPKVLVASQNARVISKPTFSWCRPLMANKLQLTRTNQTHKWSHAWWWPKTSFQPIASTHISTLTWFGRAVRDFYSFGGERQTETVVLVYNECLEMCKNGIFFLDYKLCRVGRQSQTHIKSDPSKPTCFTLNQNKCNNVPSNVVSFLSFKLFT